MWSIRMRGEAGASRRNRKAMTHKKGSETLHITGAEGLYEEAGIEKAVIGFLKRALSHSKGMPDEIVITIERLKQKPRVLQALPVRTLKCSTPSGAKKAVIAILKKSGISGRAIKTAFSVLNSIHAMRGAALVEIDSGMRMEADKQRGIRVSRMGIKKGILKSLSLRLSTSTTKLRLDTDTVKEALTLATKVASCPDIAAELCTSDDPDYTTGYIASRKLGYLRVPNIKKQGSKKGGRVFFVAEGADIAGITDYLERRPVILGRLSPILGEAGLDEVIQQGPWL